MRRCNIGHWRTGCTLLFCRSRRECADTTGYRIPARPYSEGAVSFELLDHPADIGFRARGATAAELFGNCARALVSIVLDPAEIRPLESIDVTGEGGDRESLLVNWLNEVLYYVDGRRMALGDFEIAHIDDTRVECTALGEPRDRDRHPSRLSVKAVTYHQLKLEHTGEGWVAEVFVDI
jgi:SHS2 domain-containing protein